MAPEPIELDGVEAAIWRSPQDGVLVVQIDTIEQQPATRIRVNMNDGPIWDANPETHTHTHCECIITPDPLASLKSVHDALTAGIYGQEGYQAALTQARETIDNLIDLQENNHG